MESQRQNEWWRGATLYQIYPRSFNDSNGDGIGDLQGIRNKISYLKQLGVDAVWISPFFKSPMKDFGYDISDYCDVDPIFGNLQDFDLLVKELHLSNIKVVLDLVLSHTSEEHPWFIESRSSQSNSKSDWYVWQNGTPDAPPNNWLSVFGGSAWQWDNNRQQYYLHNFLKEQPDLNFHNAHVQQALLDVIEFWLKRGVDGFRLDVCNFYFHDLQLRNNPAKESSLWPRGRDQHNPYHRWHHVFDRSRPENIDFLKKMRELLDRYGDVFTVAEIYSDQSLIRMKEYTGQPGPLHSAYCFELLVDEFRTESILKTVQKFYQEAPLGWPCWSFSNHDVPRVASRWSPASVKSLLTFLFMLKGTVILYQGEELGLEEAGIEYEDIQDPFGKAFYPKYKGRDGCRTPMPWEDNSNGGFSSHKPWLPVSSNHLFKNVLTQTQDSDSNLHLCIELINHRKKNLALQKGDFEFQVTSTNLVKIKRKYHNEIIEAWINFGTEFAELTLSQDNSILVIDNGQSSQKRQNIVLQKNDFIIFK